MQTDDTNSNLAQESIIKIKSKPSLIEDLIAYPTEPSKITSIDTEYERKDKPLSNK
ncbi:6920_t:CDS:1, partial [Dentiscutata erythropus]